MAIVSGRCALRQLNRVIEIGPAFASDIHITLPSDKKLLVGIDQSSTCTGIAVADWDFSIVMLIDFKKDSNNKEAFYRDLKKFIIRLIANKNIVYFVSEKPIPAKNQRYASQVLMELRGRLDSWVEEIPELQNCIVDSMFPQSWKSLVMDKSKGTGRTSKKECIAEDLCDIFPEFRSYALMHTSKDLDAFDALGILLGYRRYAYTVEGIPMICGTIEKRHKTLVCYRYLDAEKLKDKANLVDCFGEALSIYKPVFKAYNIGRNKVENLRMASSSCPCTITILPDKFVDELKWKFDFEVESNKVLVAYVFNTARYNKSSMDVIKEVLPWNEVIESI
jgi:hypothetical protein